MSVVFSHLVCGTFLLHPRKLEETLNPPLCWQRSRLCISQVSGSHLSAWMCCFMTRPTLRCHCLHPVFSSPGKRQSREHPGGCGYSRRNTPLGMEIGRVWGLRSWLLGLFMCCTTADGQKAQTVWEWKLPVHQHCTQRMPVRPAQGPERAVHARLPGAPLGKAVTITHEAAGKVKGSARKSACCQTPAWRDTPCLDRNKEEEIAETKPTERAACPERKMSSVVSKKRVPLAKGRVSGILEKQKGLLQQDVREPSFYENRNRGLQDHLQ